MPKGAAAFVALMAILAPACHRQPPSAVSPAPTLCEVIRRQDDYDGRVVTLRCRIESDGIEHTALTDARCGRGIAAMGVTKSASDQLRKGIYQNGLEGTLDKIITGTFTGRFRHDAGKRPVRWLEITDVSDLRVEMMQAVSLSQHAPERKVTLRCSAPGLEDYDIEVAYRFDAGGGAIRSKADSVSFGLALGPMIEPLVPAERPPGFRWIKTETLDTTVLRYGLNVRQNQLQATVFGTSFSSTANLVAPPGDTNRFVSVARAFAKATCK